MIDDESGAATKIEPNAVIQSISRDEDGNTSIDILQDEGGPQTVVLPTTALNWSFRLNLIKWQRNQLPVFYKLDVETGAFELDCAQTIGQRGDALDAIQAAAAAIGELHRILWVAATRRIIKRLNR